MKKKLVLMVAISVSIAPSVLFGAARTTGEFNGRIGSACQGTPALNPKANLPEQAFSGQISRPMAPAEEVQAATDVPIMK